MSEGIRTQLKRAAVALADELDYSRAAQRFGVSENQFRRLISELEEKLCLYLFEPMEEPPRLTSEGAFLIGVFRQAFTGDREGHSQISGSSD